MSKFLNDPADAVDESLRGLARCHADELRLNERPRFVRRSAAVPGKVALISGGGSGHEPLHAGAIRSDGAGSPAPRLWRRSRAQLPSA